jgi:hypothetical protein
MAKNLANDKPGNAHSRYHTGRCAAKMVRPGFPPLMFFKTAVQASGLHRHAQREFQDIAQFYLDSPYLSEQHETI